MTATQPKQRSYAYFESQITLHSDEAQHVTERMGQIVDDSLRNMRYGLRYATGEKNMDKIVEMVETAFTQVTTDLNEEMARVQKMIDDNGVVIPSVYKHPVTLTVRHSTPMSAHYFGIIQQLDKLISEFEKLWLSGVWKDGQRDAAGREWQRRVARLGSDINNREQRAWMSAARREKKVQEKGDKTKKHGDAMPAQVTELAAPATLENASTVAAAASPPAAEPDTVAPVVPIVTTEVPVAADPPQPDSKPARKKKAVAA